jgi:hypothetical protein
VRGGTSENVLTCGLCTKMLPRDGQGKIVHRTENCRHHGNLLPSLQQLLTLAIAMAPVAWINEPHKCPGQAFRWPPDAMETD